uniref:Receptor expression-enhancing protein n=1 Tax=Timema douglasi TaxID=61478 RepID=A0A7R8VVV4_TIMDO|nr:unnamed protein product [Timema douglasi]
MDTKLYGCKENITKTLHDENRPWTKVFDWAEKKSGVNRLYIFIASVIFLAIYMVFGFAAQLFCNIFGFLYPAYASLKALETPNKEDDTKWLTYWVVFAFFSLVEYFSDIILSWFPFYWLAKVQFPVIGSPFYSNNGALNHLTTKADGSIL